MDKVSVIIVTYNAGATLESAVMSVLTQTYTHVELIIIDGKSTDDTVDIILRNAPAIAYWISEKDKGVYDAMNKGIAASSGEWVYFLGADDILKDEHVIEDIFGGEKPHADFVYGNTRLKSNNVVLGGSRTYTGLVERNISHQAIFYKKTIFDTIGKFDLTYKVLADYDLNLRIFASKKLSKQYIGTDVSIFNDKGGMSNITIDTYFFKDKLDHFTQQENFAPNAPELQQYNFYYGVTLLFHQKKIAGLRYCFRAFTHGARKIFYMLVFIKYTLCFIGIGRKLKFTN